MASEEVTVLVFKDNDASRTFRVPLAWFSRFGLALGALVGVTILALVMAFRFYRISVTADPARLEELEVELARANQTINALESQDAPAEATPTQVASTKIEEEKAPAPKPKATHHAKAETKAVASNTQLFSALPASAGFEPVANPAQVPIEIDRIRTQWDATNRLSVRFNISYVANDNGNQSGRIVILARGSATLAGYPAGVLNPMGSESLINPNKGEYFSVSRFRETRAEFGPFQSRDEIRDVQVLIFDQNEKLLLVQKVAAGGE